MCKPPSDEAVRGMLGPALSPDVTIEKIQLVLSIRPQKIYEVSLSDGKTVQLVLPPHSMWRPLRSEQGMVASEAAAVRWMSETLTRQKTTPPIQQEGPSSSSSKPALTTTTTATTAPLLPLLLPTLLHHGQKPYLPETSFAVYAPVRGTPLALLSPAPPSPTCQQEDTDRQLGTLFRHLATLTSPTGRFGPLAAVLTGASSPQPAPHHLSVGRVAKIPKVLVEGGLSVTGGAGAWSVAFQSMLEGVLRDGEDMAVVMAYPTIRRHFRRLGYLLDEVTVGRLVVVEGAGTGNPLVVEVEEGGGQEGGKGEEEEEQGRGGEKEQEEVVGEVDTEEEKSEATTQTETDTQHTRPRPNLKLTGLRDWSSCVFGDPLLAAVFSDLHQQPPSTAFLEGFNGDDDDDDDDDKPDHPRHAHAHHHLPYPLNRTVIEDIDTAWIRLLFYQVYHAVARIVGEFYRPRQDSTARELEARRKLNEVLARLAEVPDDAKKRHKRPSGEMSPAKRIRGLGDE
ncbi:hypothetical protein C8A00DRAFT_12645 [Chaetomidium leptoderma]|uniref:Uncharacterized protein n=1 Tax=Chaetomidium leptoderma TaxID=669021 RepID=A0AAN7A009_9PEZI|nr:hypothetical protein C8A00DRAFT_12645 [Chaetomidium leptoderma]